MRRSDLLEKIFKTRNYIDERYIQPFKVFKKMWAKTWSPCHTEVHNVDLGTVCFQILCLNNIISCWSTLWNVLIHKDLQQIVVILQTLSVICPFLFQVNVGEKIMYDLNMNKFFNRKFILNGRLQNKWEATIMGSTVGVIFSSKKCWIKFMWM